MVILIDIIETLTYSSPAKGSPAWEKFKDLTSLQLDNFLTICDPQLQNVLDFLKPVIFEEHRWAHISEIHYHIWVWESEGVGTLEDWLQLDLEADENDYVAHFSMPSGVNCDHLTSVINRGLLMVKADLIQFAHETAK
ncbi:hypothetical protein V8B97DRAFT_2010275 [Scleroderma yunnanense]